MMFKKLLNLRKKRSRSLFLTVVVGLGIGFGVGITVFSNPPVLQASPNLISIFGPQQEFVKLQSSDLELELYVKSDNYIKSFLPRRDGYLVQVSDQFPNNQLTVIGGTQHLGNLEHAQLGDEINLLAENNGWYQYRVIEIRQIPLNELVDLFSQQRVKLVFYRVDLLQQQALVVLAK